MCERPLVSEIEQRDRATNRDNCILMPCTISRVIYIYLFIYLFICILTVSHEALIAGCCTCSWCWLSGHQPRTGTVAATRCTQPCPATALQPADWKARGSARRHPAGTYLLEEGPMLSAAIGFSVLVNPWLSVGSISQGAARCKEHNTESPIYTLVFAS